ncbi:MAG: aminodeoxychorismate lyase [Halofilum sp. (in: g-proteobacteria)]|nr:aminodeoxychorismate lyase [Halofilum sp. (in: g-proteobacteria)]
MNPPDAPRILVNGTECSSVDVTDRGFALGDGLFETIAIRDGVPRFWQAHAERLLDGCRRLAIPAPSMDVLAHELECVRAGASSGTARITVTRGPGPRGYAPPPEPSPTRVVGFYPAATGSAHKPRFSLRWCETRLALQPALAGLKHLNRLEQVLARAEWNDPGIDEGIMLATDGRVVECVMSNLFLVVDQTLVTPALDECGVSGVMRRQVLETARRSGIDTEVRRVEPVEVERASAVFVTNALRGIVAVERIGDLQYSPHEPVVQHLMDRLETVDG